VELRGHEPLTSCMPWEPPSTNPATRPRTQQREASDQRGTPAGRSAGSHGHARFRCCHPAATPRFDAGVALTYLEGSTAVSNSIGFPFGINRWNLMLLLHRSDRILASTSGWVLRPGIVVKDGKVLLLEFLCPRRRAGYCDPGVPGADRGPGHVSMPSMSGWMLRQGRGLPVPAGLEVSMPSLSGWVLQRSSGVAGHRLQQCISMPSMSGCVLRRAHWFNDGGHNGHVHMFLCPRCRAGCCDDGC
jgi:hypothetical protein